nr:hypothetical protein [Chloroflexus sp.]
MWEAVSVQAAVVVERIGRGGGGGEQFVLKAAEERARGEIGFG